MKDQIPKFLEKEFQKEKPRPNQFPEDIKEFIIAYACYYEYPKQFSIRQIFHLIRNGFETIPKCRLKGCRKKRIFNKSNVLTEGCCPEHTRQVRNLIKYGVKNVSQRDEIKLKIKETYQEKYGYDHPMKSTEVREKHKVTCLEKFGVENASMLPEIQEKINQTNLKKFGVKRPMQSPTVFDKMQKTAYVTKNYIWSTGEISIVQGYEPIVLKELEDNGYLFEDILTASKDMPEIYYQLDGKKHRYFPDFYIPKDNLIIEVKSDYTLNAQWDKNQAKFEATKALGYDFRLEVR